MSLWGWLFGKAPAVEAPPEPLEHGPELARILSPNFAPLPPVALRATKAVRAVPPVAVAKATKTRQPRPRRSTLKRDLAGKRFGHVVVIRLRKKRCEYAYKRISRVLSAPAPVSIHQVFGGLTVTDKHPRGVSFWVCRCTCGRIRTVSAARLTAGEVKNCGSYCDRPSVRSSAAAAAVTS